MAPSTPKTPLRTGSTNLNSPSRTSSSPSSTSIVQTLTLREFTPVSSSKNSKTLRRATLHPSIYGLLGLGLTNNLIEIWHNDDDEQRSVIAVGWLGGQGMEQRSVQLGDSILELLKDVSDLEVNFGHKIRIKSYKGSLHDATEVKVKMVEDGGSVGMRDQWWCYLEQFFWETKYVSRGMKFEHTIKGKSSRFMVEDIVGTAQKRTTLEDGLATLALDDAQLYVFSETSTVRIDSTSTPAALVATPSKAITNGTAESPAVPQISALDIGGLDAQILKIQDAIEISLYHTIKKSSRHIFSPGILLYGPPGTGKTLLLNAIAAEADANIFKIDGSLFGKYLGESEGMIRKIFTDAKKPISKSGSIIFIDEIDSLAPKRGSGDSTTSDSRVVTTLLTELDKLSLRSEGEAKVLVIAATNRPNGIDPGLRRPGRLEEEVEIGIPDAKARLEILNISFQHVSTCFSKSADGPIPAWASRTHGYVGADLVSVVNGAMKKSKIRGIRAAQSAVPRKSFARNSEIEELMEDATVTEEDVETTLKEVRPTAMRDIFLEPPKVRWSDIGGLDTVKQRLREAVEWPLKRPALFTRLGGTPRKGLLLYGPPGCSKTLTAKALATEAGLNFMAVKGPELLSMYVGESERAVREIFRKARAASPSIIFFDEIDALGGSREGIGGGRGNGVGVLTALLNEMDGIEELGNVVVLAATNRPELIDPALLRPGRLDTILYVGPPDLAARREILRIKTKKMSIACDVDLESMAIAMDGYSGAEMVNICDEAVYEAAREDYEIDAVYQRHFNVALAQGIRQITEEMRRGYESWSVGGLKKM